MKRQLTQKEKQYLADLHYEGEGDEFYHKYQNMWIAVVSNTTFSVMKKIRHIWMPRLLPSDC